MAAFRVVADLLRARNLRDGRSVVRSAAATEAEPIAFTRTDIGEPEDEDFYSILGIVSVTAQPSDRRVSSISAISFCTCSLSMLTTVK